jgi:hypothetical protein
MSGQAELLTELQLLLMEQRDAARENLSVDEIQDYAERQRRIEALLLQLNSDGLPEPAPAHAPHL